MASLEWCAGFFEGEGNFRINIAKGKKRYLHLQVAQVYREPLDAFYEQFKLGNVRGPYGPYSTTKQPYYTFVAYGEAAREIAEKLLPYLIIKAVQVRKTIGEFDG